MDDYVVFFVIAISLIVISIVFGIILFSNKLKKLTETISKSNTDMAKKISADLIDNSNKIINQLNNEFTLLTEFSEFIRNNLKLYSDTVIVNLSDLYENSEKSLKIHENALNDISSILKKELNDLRSISDKSRDNINHQVITTMENLQKSLSNYQTQIGTILKNGLDNIDRSLRETIDVN